MNNTEKHCTKYLASKKIEFCIQDKSYEYQKTFEEGFTIYYDVVVWKRKRNYNKKLPENLNYFFGEFDTVESAVIKIKRGFNIIEER